MFLKHNFTLDLYEPLRPCTKTFNKVYQKTEKLTYLFKLLEQTMDPLSRWSQGCEPRGVPVAPGSHLSLKGIDEGSYQLC